MPVVQFEPTDPERFSPRAVLGFQRFARTVAWVTAVTSAIVLVGWVARSALMASLFTGLRPMRAQTALGFLCAGLALLAARRDDDRSRRWCGLMGAAVLGLGAANLIEHFRLADLGLTAWTLAFRGSDISARMPPVAGLAFVLFGLRGMVYCRGQMTLFGEFLSLLLLAICMTALAAIGVTAAEGAQSIFSPVSPLAAVLLFGNALAWIAVRPTSPLCAVAALRGYGGLFARRLLLPALLLPLLYAWVLQATRRYLNIDEPSVLALGAFVTGGSVALLVWYVAQLSERVEAEQRAARGFNDAAHTDSLTGLPNRRAFDEAVQHLLHGRREQDRDFSLLMLDLDHFKDFNDTYGHLDGDEVLRRVGGLLRRDLRPEDVAARYGGEEFAVLLAETDRPRALQAAERVRAAFHADRWPHGPVTASIGVAAARRDDSAASLVARADAALYAAKHAGRDRIACEPAVALADVARTA